MSDQIKRITTETLNRIANLLQVKGERADIAVDWACPQGTAKIENGTRYCIHECARPYCLIELPESHLEPCYTCEVENGTGWLYDCRGPQANDTTSYGVQDVHYVLHVAALSDSCVGGILAFASPCYLRSGDYRPLIGFINMCPRWIDIFAQFDEEIFDIIIQHEIFHALGFSPALYAFFRDENGDPRTPVNETTGLPEINYELGVYQWSDTVIKEVTLDWDVRDGVFNRTVRLFVTPNLVREAREHFGCPTLEGVEIEDNMGQTGGTGLAHFEQRIMGGESMTGFISFLRIFSRFSLAFFEDTGWYSANYDQADPFNYGKNLGCDFVTKSCKWLMDTKRSRGDSIEPFCDQINAPQCDAERGFSGRCNLMRFDQPLPSLYQYFDSLPDVNETEIAYYGGQYGTADHCPYVTVS
ncbi:leishmanolysin-like peptidase [Diadema antillarum]|uniref:leishmanolysin-like peptidase n=1 Tax=Diadema antillarum TaxID=105358 RepID=UPI003A8A7B8B